MNGLTYKFQALSNTNSIDYNHKYQHEALHYCTAAKYCLFKK